MTERSPARAPGSAAWLWLSGLVFVADQLTKLAAERLLQLHQPVPVLPSLNLMLTYNLGAAFSLLRDAGGWQRWFFAGFAAAVSAALVVWLVRLPRTERWTAVALSLVLGGALGNLADRIVRGAVVDFLDVYYDAWHWPAFNVADAAICVGAGMLVVDALRPRRAAGG